jgi:iron(III) transport system substrate-binding protein
MCTRRSIQRRSRSVAGLALLVTVLFAGCWSAAPEEVVVYTALDREFSEPILDQFQRKTGIRVLAKYDVESTKTVNLVNAIIQEGDRPRCDLFWNNEILHTLRLDELGLLDSYACPRAAEYPPAYRGADNEWFGFAARIRVLIVNTDLVPPAERPTSIHDLVDPKWQGRVGIAKPLFGTTATHAAVLFAAWGEDRAQDYFRRLQENAEVLAGNKQVALNVAAGRLAFGWTDTDDAIIERDKGLPVEIVYPDQEPDGLGALFIPNTLALIRGAPHPAHARRLVDYLLSPAVEAQLAAGRSAQFPLNSAVDAKSHAAGDQPIRHMEVDFAAAAAQWDKAAAFLRDEFTGP